MLASICCRKRAGSWYPDLPAELIAGPTHALALPCLAGTGGRATPAHLPVMHGRMIPQGSGKTLAFGLPILQQLAAEGEANLPQPQALRALIFAPTRELALQVWQAVGLLCWCKQPAWDNCPVSCTLWAPVAPALPCPLLNIAASHDQPLLVSDVPCGAPPYGIAQASTICAQPSRSEPAQARMYFDQLTKDCLCQHC